MISFRYRRNLELPRKAAGGVVATLNRGGAMGRARPRRILAAPLGLISPVLAFCLLALLAPSAQASKDVVGYIGAEQSGGLGGQFEKPMDVAVNVNGAGGAAPGDLYVADSKNGRIDQLSASGAFVRSWGYEDVASGSDYIEGGGFEICSANPPSNDVCQSGGNSGAGPSPAGKLLEPSDLAINQSTGDVFVADRLGRIAEFSAVGAQIRYFGQNVVSSGPDRVTPTSDVQTLTVAASGGKYTLEFGGERTGELTFNAPAGGAGGVQEALEKLLDIGSGNVSVGKTAVNVYKITFAGQLADNPEPVITAAPGLEEPLTGGDASVADTTLGATGFDVCEPANGDVCQRGESGFAETPLAVAPVGSPNAGDVLVGNREYTETGTFVRSFGWGAIAAGPGKSPTEGFEVCSAAAGDACGGIAGNGVGQISGLTGVVEDASGDIYTAESYVYGANYRAQKFTPTLTPPGLSPSIFIPEGSSEADAPLALALGPGGSILVSMNFPSGATATCPDGSPSEAESRILEMTPAGALLDTDLTCNSIFMGSTQSDPPSLFGANTATGDIYVPLGKEGGPQRIFILGAGGGSPDASIETVTPNTAGATVAATINPNGPGNGHPNPTTTSYRVEYKLASETNWAQFGSETNVGSGTAGVPVTVHLGGLEANKTYEVRLVVEKQYGEGTVIAGPQKFATLAVAPTIESFSSSDVTQDSAILHAKVNPHGTATRCHFEYGTTIAYGQTALCPDNGEVGSGQGDQEVEVQLENLQVGATYHFRFIAENSVGTVASEDQSFEFFPPNCPNAAVRQQTGSNYLPDCRAYELVSPPNAGGTLFYAGGPNTGQATNPPRFSYTGAWSEIPGAKAINTVGDLYVSTRTDQGWASKYVGLPGNQAGCAGGPPTDATSRDAAENPPWLTDTVQANPSMNQFLDWNDGAPTQCGLGTNGLGDANYLLAPQSNAPYLWNAEGNLLQHLPTDLGQVAEAENAFKCPYIGETEELSICSGETVGSGDLSHIAFSSRELSFAGSEGLTEAPGSAYDNEIATGTVKLISRLPGGANISQDPAFALVPSGSGRNPAETPGGKEEFIRFPAVSTNGSHILMSTATASTPFCERSTSGPEVCPRFTDTPIHLYLSIDDAAVIEIAGGKPVHYIGMTPDGSKVFFTSNEQLTEEDKDTSTDLYMWSEAGEKVGHPLTLISKGDNSGIKGEPGNTDECAATWVAKCDVVPYSGYAYSWLTGGVGGNGISDSPIAANGDIYFYSPEQLDGNQGIVGRENLYDYRNGEVQFVATLNSEQKCETTGFGEQICSEGPIVRMQVTPDDSHMAFVTASPLTPYDNAGHLEMYSYSPSSGAISCDSCNPDGQPATADVRASQDGLFQTDDGRTFFSTTEALVSQDTDEAEDVYEYVDGRPQLITPGTGTSLPPQGEEIGNGKGVNLVSISETAGLVGVSADGTDVYFSTYDSLVPEDHNGDFLKFYDARSGGGFAQPTPVPPCSAAEECHGAGNESSSLPTQGTAARLSGGNVQRGRSRRNKRLHRRAGHKRRHARASVRGRARG